MSRVMQDSVPLCTTPGTQGGAPGTQGGGTEDSVPLGTTLYHSVPLCTTPGIATESTYHLLVSPAFDVPNGDFDGPLQGKFKLVKRDLDPQHQLQLETHGWEVTSAGSGLLGSAKSQAMRQAATQNDTKNIVFIPKDWGESSHGGEDDGQQLCTAPPTDSQINNAPPTDSQIVPALEWQESVGISRNQS